MIATSFSHLETGNFEEPVLQVSFRDTRPPYCGVTGSHCNCSDLLRASVDWLWEVDQQFIVTAISDEVTRILKIPSSRLIGQSLMDLLCENEFGTERDTLEQKLNAKQPFRDLPFHMAGPDGEAVKQRLCGVPKFDRRSGQFLGFRGTAIDDSINDRLENRVSHYRRVLDETMETLRLRNQQLNRALNAARAADQAKTRFLKDMSHEFRTPLNSIIGYAEAVERGTLGRDPGFVQKLMGRMRESGERLVRTIDRILHYANVEDGTLDITFEYVAVDEATGQAFEHVRERAVERGINVNQIATSTGMYVWADQTHLVEALTHLLRNAITHAQPNGSVGVRAEPTILSGNGAKSQDHANASFGGHHSAIAIAVWDDGAGVPDVDDSTAFAPFTRLHNDDPMATQGENGLGLGLATAKRLAHAMGGDLRIKREVAQGAEIHLILPTSDRRSLAETGHS